MTRGTAHPRSDMQYTIVHHDRATSPEAARTQHSNYRPLIKIGLDVHSRFYVAVTQHDHAMPRPPQRFSPEAFVPWVHGLLQSAEVHVVYESCGFGFGLHRALLAAGAHCYVISPQALDEGHTGVKTDGRDARTLCQRLGRYLHGNGHELAVIRVPSEVEDRSLTGAVYRARRLRLSWASFRFPDLHRSPCCCRPTTDTHG